MKRKLLIGAYAAYATLSDKSRAQEEKFWAGLRTLEGVRGLELPLFIDHEDAPLRLSLLPKDWDYVLTLLPGTMQHLQRDPHYGLASANDGGRQAALAFTDRARRWISSINEHCGRQAVLAVEVHSAPTQLVPFDKQRLKAALTRLLAADWAGAKLLIEHCDAWKDSETSIKGFMSLNDELEVAQAVPIQLSLNWGRSVLEARSVDHALLHLKQVLQAGCLGAYFFSGTAAEDPLYGQWQDNHAPLKTGGNHAWEPKGGLLDEAQVQRVAALLPKTADFPLGIKVQPFPTTLTLTERLAFLEAQIAAFLQVLETPA